MFDFKKLIAYSGKPPVFEKGLDSIWTDESISGKMLEAHLNPDVDAASRKHEMIDQSVRWIQDHIIQNRSEFSILDLGCGPGLYCERLYQKGMQITGIDFSQRSIRYAREQAALKKMDIRYVSSDYLTMDYDSQFDLVFIIFCDFPVLPPADKILLLKKIFKALKPGGKLLFDVFTSRYQKYQKESIHWEAAESGFWSDRPYLCLAQDFHYPEHDAFLNQYIVLENDLKLRLYRVWDEYYSEEKIRKLLKEHHFTDIEIYGDVTGRVYTEHSETMGILAVKES
jgi:SAM-dependent methyltransferase